MKKKLYVITNLNLGEDGKPFALCDKCFKEWEPKVKGKIVFRVIGENTKEPCNECGI